MKNKRLYIWILVWAMLLFTTMSISRAQDQAASKIAFLADVHLQDVFAELDDPDFRGVYHEKSGKMATIRTMKSQLNSTRLFNENYFAFISVLEELQKQHIKLVVLPGDFTDDGQPMNVLAVKRIMKQYADKYGMRFFLTTGNHDPVKPFGGTAGKDDFLGEHGQEQRVQGNFSADTLVSVTDQINYWGYYEICSELADFGFYPNIGDVFWTNPFLMFEYEQYDYHKTIALAGIENRLYKLEGTELYIPDASYLVEPVEGVWLLALDGNVYTPSYSLKDSSLIDWKGSGDGFNQAIHQKSYQLEWIKKVSEEAKKRNKILISFSHYPLTDFHEGASPQMKKLFGIDKFQLQRVPHSGIADAYAAAGIQVHFAGHMHINDTEVFTSEKGNRLFNIQVPSLAAFPAGYKTLTIKDMESLEITSHWLSNVDRMDEFFDLYEMEHNYLLHNHPSSIWKKDILKSSTYQEYTVSHLKELIRLRFITNDWPEDLAFVLNRLTEAELKVWAALDDVAGEEYLQNTIEKVKNYPPSTLEGIVDNGDMPNQIIQDFYLVKNGDEYGKELIPTDRLQLYLKIFEASGHKCNTKDDGMNYQLKSFFQIFRQMLHSYPSNHFVINIEDQTITTLK